MTCCEDDGPAMDGMETEENKKINKTNKIGRIVQSIIGLLTPL